MVHQIKLNVQIVITMLDRTSKYLPIFIRKRNSFPGDLITAFIGLFLVTTVPINQLFASALRLAEFC